MRTRRGRRSWRRLVGQARQACADRDLRLARLEAELDLSRSEAQSTLRGLAALGAELEALRVSSRATATRIRLQALSEAGTVGAAIRDLGSLPEDATGPLLAALERALDRVADEWGDAEDAIEATEELARAAEPAGQLRPSAAPAPAAPSPDGARRISVDVGPFSDFSQLVSFEDAANAIGATGEISIRRFSGGRAEIDVEMKGPGDLLRELEERCDLEFEVRNNQDDSIVLDLGE